MDRAMDKIDMVPALWNLEFSMMSVTQEEIQDVMTGYGQGSLFWGSDA